MSIATIMSSTELSEGGVRKRMNAPTYNTFHVELFQLNNFARQNKS